MCYLASYGSHGCPRYSYSFRDCYSHHPSYYINVISNDPCTKHPLIIPFTSAERRRHWVTLHPVINICHVHFKILLELSVILEFFGKNRTGCCTSTFTESSIACNTYHTTRTYRALVPKCGQ
jgi:hypothetical protein